MKAKLLIAALLIVLAAAFSLRLQGSGSVVRVSDGEKVSFNDMIRDVQKADIVFVGEVHDVPQHHELELRVIRAMRASRARLTVGLEMFRKDSQKDLDAWVAGSLPLKQFLPIYYDNWRQPWPNYREILTFARRQRVPLLGLNIDDDITEAVAENGFASLSALQKRQLPPGISCDIDPTYKEFIRKAYAGHAGSADKKFQNFCEAQMVWDKAMAWSLISYLDRNPGRTVVVLAGVGHAWRRGIPEQVARQSGYNSRIIMPIVPDHIEAEAVTPSDADYVVVK